MLIEEERGIGNAYVCVYPCVYYHGRAVFMLYVNDGIFAGPSKPEIAMLIKRMQVEFNVTDDGDIKEYLGVLVER
jgi:hypothetical protein